MTKNKICLVIPSLHPGGMERVMAELANYFVIQPHIDVHLILYGRNRDVFYSINENIKVYRPSFTFNNKWRLWHTIKTLFFLRQQIKSLQPSTVLSFGEVWNNFVLLACWGLTYPIFVSDRCQPDKQWSFLQRNLRGLLYSRAAGIIAQTERAKNIYQAIFSHPNIQVIGNPIRSIDEGSTAVKENIVLSVGRLISTKHHDDLIRIFARINPINWKLIIVGGDALKQQNSLRLQTLIQELDMGDKIELAGKRADVDDFYRKSEIFAFTSSSEGFPNVIGEAMSAGLPVVAYDCVAGPSDLIDHQETGFLVPLYDSQSFQKYLEQLILDPNLRSTMGAKGRERIKNFAVPEVAKAFESFILNESITD